MTCDIIHHVFLSWVSKCVYTYQYYCHYIHRVIAIYLSVCLSRVSRDRQSLKRLGVRGLTQAWLHSASSVTPPNGLSTTSPQSWIMTLTICIKKPSYILEVIRCLKWRQLNLYYAQTLPIPVLHLILQWPCELGLLNASGRRWGQACLKNKLRTQKGVMRIVLKSGDLTSWMSLCTRSSAHPLLARLRSAPPPPLVQRCFNVTAREDQMAESCLQEGAPSQGICVLPLYAYTMAAKGKPLLFNLPPYLLFASFWGA